MLPELKVGDESRACVLGEKFKVRFEYDAEWFEFYDNVKGYIPVDAPVSYVMDEDINMWVDSDNARDCITSCSYAKVLVFINLAPLVWY